ncbi:MAG: phytanoyl-CoA dioxygenase family protein [Myxococcota bacterium]|nr:phytanoyl-CoA dioxygenase family protein [Myxococcota bacterium]
MDGRLTSDERCAWERDGFFVRRRVFSRTEVERLRAAAERVAARAEAASGKGGDSYHIDGNRYHEAAGSTIQFEHAPGSKTLRVIEPFHHLDEELDRLIDDERIVAPMRELVGAEHVALFTDKLNLKRPREGSRFRWHQDSPYWAHFCAHLDQLPNVMVALDDASEENGCFRVVAGSHKQGLLPGLEGEGRLGPLFTDPRFFDESRQVLAEVPAGSLVFFSAHTVHGSLPNESDRRRRAFVITYQPGGYRMFKIDAVREAGAA